MTRVTFNLIPLSPVHVGCGDTLEPDGYILDEDTVVPFEAGHVINDMPQGARKRYRQHLDHGRLEEAERELKACINPQRHGRDRIAVSPESRSALTGARERGRQGAIERFVRDGFGRPYIPGSSIKGAIRTAVVSHLAQSHPGEVEAALNAAGKASHKGANAEAAALGLWDEAKQRPLPETSRDPFRFLHVGDVPLPAGSTRIDKLALWQARQDDRGEQDMQMHFERLRARIDYEESQDKADRIIPSVTIDVRQEMLDALGRMAEAADIPLPRTTPGIHDVRDWLNTFYSGRFAHEKARHFSRTASLDQLVKPILQLIESRESGEARLDNADWRNFILLRIGRFSHFESLSMDGFREGFNRQKRMPITEGASRTVIKHESRQHGHTVVPFGWVLLYAKDGLP